MRILLDESLPRRLRHELTGHTVKTVTEMGWSGVDNGELLTRAAGQFVMLVARTNRFEELQPLVPELLSRLATLRSKTLLRIGA